MFSIHLDTFYCATHVGMTNNKHSSTLQRKKSLLNQIDEAKVSDDSIVFCTKART